MPNSTSEGGVKNAAFANCAGVAFGAFHPREALSHRLFDPDWNDKQVGPVPVDRYQGNPWGLKHMLGNVAEWTRTAYRPYPYVAGDGRNDITATGKRVVRGGSFFFPHPNSIGADRSLIPSVAVSPCVVCGTRLVSG